MKCQQIRKSAFLPWRSTFFWVCGKCKESVVFFRWKAIGNRLESPVLSRLYGDCHDYGAILPIVQRLRSNRC